MGIWLILKTFSAALGVSWVSHDQPITRSPRSRLTSLVAASSDALTTR